MNPTVGQTSTLDPKLKEAYDRVMGTAAMSAPQPAPPLSPKPVNTEPIVAEEPKIAQRAPETTNPTMVENQTAPSMTTAGAEKKSKGISPIIFIVGGVVFFASYAVIWLKVFGVI